MTVEQKVIAKIRKIFLADSVIIGYTDTRIYPSHVSTIDKPQYPAISLHLLRSNARFAEVNYVDVDIQIDAWLPMSQYSFSDTQAILDRVRALLQRQNLNDAVINIYGNGFETSVGATMVEEDTKLLHLPTTYKFTAFQK